MPPDSEIVCPFCGHRSVFGEDDYGYTCPCGATAASKEFLIALEVVPDDTDEIICEWWLGKGRRLSDEVSNYVTHTDRPLLMLWAKRRGALAP